MRVLLDDRGGPGVSGVASGFDNAATALDHGAGRAHVFVRRETVPDSNPLRWMEFPGMQERFYDVDDIAPWSDRHPPAVDHPAGRSPYLGPAAPLLHGARTSMGVTAHQLSGIYGGIGWIASAITTSITRENWNLLARDFASFEHAEVHSVGPHDPSDGWYPSAPPY